MKRSEAREKMKASKNQRHESTQTSKARKT